MVRALLLIYVFVGFGFHRLRRCLIYVALTLTPNHICAKPAPSRVILNAEAENKHAEACAVRRAQFTPLYLFFCGWSSRV